MLPTPSWLRLKKWRLKRGGGTQESTSRLDDLSPGDDQFQVNPSQEREREPPTTCTKSTNYRRAPAVGTPAHLKQSSSCCDDRQLRESPTLPRGRRERPCRLACLIPRSLSNLLSRALSPASRRQQSGDCCPRVDLAGGDGSAARPESPLRRLQKHLASRGRAPASGARHEELAAAKAPEQTPALSRPESTGANDRRVAAGSASGEGRVALAAAGSARKPASAHNGRCHLTARTRDNQCALHAGSSLAATGAPPPPPPPPQQNKADKISSRAPDGRPPPLARRRPSPRDKAKGVPTWPLAKQTLDNNLPGELRLGHFGDCEDILSAHLAGRLFGALTARTDLDEGNQFQARDSRSLEAETTACELRLADQLRAFNYNHKRPFGATYESPSTGWLYNAAGLPPTLAGSSASMKAKLFASAGYRRRSYDDQEGDNDVHIILQPADIEDMERKAKAKFAQFKAEAGDCNLARGQPEVVANSSPAARQQRRPPPKASKLAALTSIFEDVKLAKCLLDQDYHQTVRLFVSRSALNWNFNAFTFDALCCGRSLTELLMHLFDFYDFHKVFQLDIVKVLKCFRLLEFGYHSTNPYHNSVHAADVTQAMHCFIQERRIRNHMTHLEILSSILAAVCHDLDHPGVNQSFLVATNNPLASLYCNTSVLENHHWRFALCIFKESRLFDHFEPQMLADMKEQLKHLILATDIARQNDYLRRFRELTSSRAFSMANVQDRALVLQMALKCADLGNPCRPWLISRVWSNLICDEFYRMGQVERRLGVPLTPICQRDKTSIAGIQTDFFRFIVLPLLELWHGFLGSPLSQVLMSNFEHNYKRWQRANRIVQQLRRRKSVACLEPAEDNEAALVDSDSESPPAHLHRGGARSRRHDRSSSLFSDPIVESIYAGHAFEAVKRASSDYVKSGNGRLEQLRDFQLNRAIEKSPQIARAYRLRANNKKQLRAVAAARQNVQPHPPSPASQTTTTTTGGQIAATSPEETASAKSALVSVDRASEIAALYRHKPLSPIQDGEWMSSSPDNHHHQKATSTSTASATTTADEHFDASSPASSPASRASSACSSPVGQQRALLPSRGGPFSDYHQRHHLHQKASGLHQRHHHHQHHHQQPHQEHPSSGPLKLKPSNLASARQSVSHQRSFYNIRRRESDPGCLTQNYELAAAIVLIQYQNNSLFHKRRSSLPISVSKRRSSK